MTHPFRIGDPIKIAKTKKYGHVVHLNAGILVRLKNGRMEQIAPQLLEFNYGK